MPESGDSLAAELGLEEGERELVAGLLRLGVGADQIRAAAQHGRLEDAVFEDLFDPDRDRRTVSAAEIEADGGLPASEILATLHGFGLPTPAADEPYFTPEEASAFRELGLVGEIWPRDVRLETARVYGQALGRVAQTELHLFRSRVQPWIEEVSPNPLDGLAAVRQAFQLLLPLAERMILGVHRRKIEQELTQAAVWEVEREAEGLVPGSVEVTLLFCDLRHFTSWANRHGDAAAIEVLERFEDAVSENLGETGRLVKSLGDGHMLAYPEPGAAVAAALAIAAARRDGEGPPIHASMHHGRAVFRDGDYYGRAVNLTARLLTVAGGDELLATEDVVEAAPQYPWAHRGARRLRGFQDSLEIFALDLRGEA